VGDRDGEATVTIMVMDAPIIAPTVTIMVTVEGLGQDMRASADERREGWQIRM